MTRQGNKFKKKGALGPQSSSTVIEKRFMKGNKQNNPAAPLYVHALAYPNVPAYVNDQSSGYIFMCNGQTKTDCYKYRVFGLPHARMDIVEKIKLHMKLFLFDFDLKILYGVYIAASNGELGIEPAAFGGKFSAQVRFEIFKDCLPLHESVFSHAIADNYRGSKFKQELNNEQVANLISLFRPVVFPSPGTASSRMPNIVQQETVISQSIEVRAQPAAQLSASYDQLIAQLQPIHAGAASDFQHGHESSLPHASHVPTTANLAYLQQPLASSQPQFVPSYPSEANHSYFPQNRATRTSGRAQSSTLEHGHEYLPPSPLTAAYWAKVAASADPNQDYYPAYQSAPSGQNIPIPFAGVGPAYPAVQESRDDETVPPSSNVNDHNHNVALSVTNSHAPTESIVPLHFQAPSHGPTTQLPSSSSGAVYWGPMASQDQAHVYTGPRQGLPSVGAVYWGAPASQDQAHVYTGPHQALLQAGGTDAQLGNVAQLGYPYGYHYNAEVVPPANNITSQAHGQVLSQVPAANFHGSTHSVSFSSGTASYWARVAYEDPSQVVPTASVVPSSSEVDARGKAATPKELA